MATTTIQPARSVAHWLRRGALLLAALVVLLIATFLWRPASTVNAIATMALRLRGIQSHYVHLGPYRIH